VSVLTTSRRPAAAEGPRPKVEAEGVATPPYRPTRQPPNSGRRPVRPLLESTTCVEKKPTLKAQCH
jgi:hypothetical protein